MKSYLNRIFSTILLLFPLVVFGQQTVTVISRCGGVDTVTIPNIVDNDLDGMDDALEQKLLNHFMPTIIQFSSENCPGPALDGTGDSNLIACHIYPIPEQYAVSTDLNLVSTHPTPVVASRALTPGLVWYSPMVKINCAMLYGQDCGLLGHTADVEGFNFSVKYIGPDTVAGWMYDTIMHNWTGGTIQTVSHAGTLCEQVETYPYRSITAPNGKDTVFASPDKHGNYLTVGQCGASFICNPGCSGTKITRAVRDVNIGEPNASLVPDLGTIYAAYAGEDPWTTSNFLNSHGGNAGAIRDKMLLSLSSDFISGYTLTAPEICPIYQNCFGVSGSSYLHYTCDGDTYGFYSQQLTTSGTYQHVLTNSYGCDSTITLNLTIVQPDTTNISAAICNGTAYSFNGQSITTAGVYVDSLVNQYGCDSVVTLSLTVNPTDSVAVNAAICAGSSYNFNGLMLDSSGVYTGSFANSYGCDSIVTLTLSVQSPLLTQLTATICQGQAFNGYDSTGIYNDTMTASTGCDSIVTLNLVVQPIISDSATVSICSGQSINGHNATGLYIDTLVASTGCDSIVTLDLTVQPQLMDTLTASICQGQNLNGHDSTGVYTDTLTASTGCDSLATTILTVEPLPALPVIIGNGNTLTVADTTGLQSYQWYLAGNPIPNADSSTYNIGASGYYSVQVTNMYGCTALSDSASFTWMGIDEQVPNNGIALYPNPTKGLVLVTLPNVITSSPTEVVVLNLLGMQVQQTITTTNKQVTLDVKGLAAGVYLVKVKTSGHQYLARLIKE